MRNLIAPCKVRQISLAPLAKTTQHNPQHRGHQHVELFFPPGTCRPSCTMPCATASYCPSRQETYFSPQFPVDPGFFPWISCSPHECPALLSCSSPPVHQILAVSATEAAFCSRSFGSLWQEGRKWTFFPYSQQRDCPCHVEIELFLEMKSLQVLPILPRS